MDTENIEDFANKVVNFLKTNGKFDEFRKKCASEIEQHVSFVKARKEVEELVRLRVVNNRKSSCPLTKNQLRHEIRAMLSKRKDLLAAADSSIQFSLRNNRELFASEINELTGEFEEEEKAAAEAKKLELAEKALQENQEMEKSNITEAEVDIPPPPPPPPPPAPVRQPTALPIISDNDTALLIQESVFHQDVLSGSSHNTASHGMDITDLLANVQSSDFAAQQISPPPSEQEQETPNYPSFHEIESTRDMSRSPERDTADTLVIMSKQDVAKEIYNFEKEDKQFSHYNKEDDYDKSKYPDDSRDYKYGDPRYDYSDYKRSSSSYKSSRKHGDDYRERSSSSKHRERSVSPSKYADKYKEYSLRDYGHSMDRMFKSPEYYLSISRSTSGRSSSSKESSRERRKREEEYYQKYGYSSKYGHLPPYSSHKYAESSRRDEYYKDYYDKRRHEDPYYKSSSERSKNRDYALYESSKGRESSHDPYKIRDAAYEISKIRESVSAESSKFKEPPYGSSKYHDHNHELLKAREREHIYRARMKDEFYNSTVDNKERRTPTERSLSYDTPSKPSSSEVKYNTPKVLSPLKSPKELHLPINENVRSPENVISPPKELVDEESSTSRNDLDDMLERAISNIPRTPEEPSPVSPIKGEESSKDEIKSNAPENNIDYYSKSPTKLPSPTKPLPHSPLKPISDLDNLTDFEMQVRETKVNDPSRQALIDSILPKPKYCSILKETFAVAEGSSLNKNTSKDAEVGESTTKIEMYLALALKESIEALSKDADDTEVQESRNESTDFEQGTTLNKYDLASPSITSPFDNNEVLKADRQSEELTHMIKEVVEPPKEDSFLKHDNQDFPVPSSPPAPSTPESAAVKSSPSIPTALHPVSSPSSFALQKAIALKTEAMPNRGPLSPTPTSSSTKDLPATKHAASNISEILKATPSKPIVLTTTRRKQRVSKPNDSSDAEEGEILSDTEESHALVGEDLCEGVNDIVEDPVVEPMTVTEEDTKVNKENKCSADDQVDVQPLADKEPSVIIPQPPEPKAFVPDENFPIRSKRDLFKARFFQPDMKIDFAKPEEVAETNPKLDSSGASEKEDQDKTQTPQAMEVKPNPDEMRYSRKMRFKEVLQQHINDQENEIRKEQQMKESQQKDNQKEEAASESGFGSQHICSALPLAEPDVSAVSLSGKRKRFLNDYIASLESNAPPAKSTKTEEALVEESLPKLRIKPLSGGSYSSETLASASSAPPPLHKASTTSPELEAVPKCIIKLGKGNWSTCETEKPERPGKRKGIAPTRINLRSREASTDSSKSENLIDKPRTTRLKQTRSSVKSHNVDEDEKNSDNSFEEVDKSRKSGRTRKTIKRLNL